MVVILSIYVNLSFYTCVQKNFFPLRLLFCKADHLQTLFVICRSVTHGRKERLRRGTRKKMSTKFEQTPKAENKFGTFVAPLVKPTSLLDFNFIS